MKCATCGRPAWPGLWRWCSAVYCSRVCLDIDRPRCDDGVLCVYVARESQHTLAIEWDRCESRCELTADEREQILTEAERTYWEEAA